VFISADMEGITGVVNAAQLGPGEFEYERFRKLMTGEVNAAITGAVAAGATAVTVADSHGNMLSLLPEELDPRARLIRSAPRPLGMMEGVEQGFDAVLFVGYHASIAAVAGHYGAPVVFVSGDDRAVEEVQRLVDPAITGVAVKRAIGYHSADNLAPEVARALIRDGVKSALLRARSARPFRLSAPVRFEISFKNMINAEVLAFLPNVERVDGATIAFTGKDAPEVARFLSFVTNYDPAQ
jgi:D-amino peptidase